MSAPRTETVPDTSWNLLRSVQAGSPEAWRRLVLLYAPVLSRWCRRAGLQDADTDNVLQEVFLAVARNLASFRSDRGSGRFRAWLSTVTRTHLADHWRRQGRQPPALGGSDALRELEGRPAPEPAEVDSVFRSLELRRALEIVQQEVQPKTWDAFWRTAIEEGGDPEVAGELGLTPGAVRQARFRVLHRLRELLQ
jgi:RNA polymerase sigma-70 factor (ECF subfamily)